MPRENRKRGKKHKKEAVGEPDAPPVAPVKSKEQPEAGPSWIIQKTQAEVDLEAPFGYLDSEVKAYFRTVDVQLRQWQDAGAEVDEEEKRAFFMAALTEMNGQEKQLATDPDCSLILERVVHSMDDFARRVFADRLAGSYETLSKHRFASHVIQTLVSLGGDTVSRETKGALPAECPPELPTMTRLILDISDELLPSLPVLLNDAFASHILRVLLSLLAGLPSTLPSTSQSKKSKKWKDRQGEMKSLFDSNARSPPVVPPVFGKKATAVIQSCRKDMTDNEVRACAASRVACPTLDVLITVEANRGLSNEKGSLLDMLTSGMVGDILSGNDSPSEPSAYIVTLLKDTTSSHLLETVLLYAPQAVFDRLWNTFLCPKGDASKIGVHPVSNFVLAKAVSRASPDQLDTMGRAWWHKAAKAGRLGVIKAVVDRAVEIKAGAEGIWESVKEAFSVSESDSEVTIRCVLCLQTLEEYRASDTPEPNVQGALLLQSILRLPDPHNGEIIDTILSLPISSLKSLAHHPISSRVLDVLLDSPSVPYKAKRRFVLGWLDHYPELVDDRIGSRVGERCWRWGDTYTKEKIARSVMKQEQTLLTSYYGKYFARALNLYVLRTKPDEWRDLMGRQNQVVVEEKPKVEVEVEVEVAKKRKHERGADEIEVLFKKAKKMQKGALEEQSVGEKPAVEVDAAVLAAIRAAPSGEKKRKH